MSYDNIIKHFQPPRTKRIILATEMLEKKRQPPGEDINTVLTLVFITQRKNLQFARKLDWNNYGQNTNIIL